MDFTDITVGERFALGPVRMKKEKIVSFAHEYDPLPFHYDEDYAKTTRYKAMIAPGVMTFMSVWSEFIRNAPWKENIIGGTSTKIEWLAPVYVDDEIRGEAVISNKTRRNPYNGSVEITVAFFNQNGAKVMHNVTEMVVAG